MLENLLIDGNMKYLEMIKIPQLQNFTAEALNLYSDDEKFEKANQVAEVIIATLEKKKLIDEHSHQSFVDVMLTAALIYNAFDANEGWENSFRHRLNLDLLAMEHGIDAQIREAIFATIEAQLGEDMPVQNSRPKPGTPTEVFATSVWFVESYLHESSKSN